MGYEGVTSMVRLAILLVLLCLTLWEWIAGPRKAVYWLAMASLFVFFSLRYGQGTDYITYMSIYANVQPLHTLPNYFAYRYDTIEIGFYYLMSFFRMLRLHYAVFIALVTLFGLLGLNRFIKRFCPLPMFALTVFFAIYSLTYMESAIRQLLSISILVGFVLIDWADGRKWRALLGIVAAAFLHTSALALIALPVLFYGPRRLYVIEWKLRTTLLVGAGLLGVAAVLTFVNLTPVLKLLPAQLEYKLLTYYEQNHSFSLLALGNRALFMLIVFALAYRARHWLGEEEKLLFNLYCVGFGVYLLLMSFDLIASRTSTYFRVVDVVLIPLLMHKNRDLVKKTIVALPVLLGLMAFLYVKDMTAILGFAEYYGNNPLQYPYVTVFNPDTLLDHKFVNVKNANAMNAYQTSGFSWDEYYDTLQRKPSVRSPILPY